MTHDTTVVAEYGYCGPITNYYVNDETPEDGIAPGDDNNDGLRPQTPIRHIHAILDRYTELGWGDIINVSAGTYTENILIAEGYTGLSLKGAGQDTTIIDGNESAPCLKLVGSAAGAITGFTFKNGSDARGGGIWNESSSPAISQCRFFNNDGGSYGGGIYNAGTSRPIISNCTFTANIAWRGGAMCNRGTSEPRITACTFRGNSSDSHGGAIYDTENCSPKIDNCIFAGNKSGSVGGGIANVGDVTTFINNTTFTKNKANNGGGVFSGDNIHVTVTNSIFWDDTPAELSVSTKTALFMYCNVEGGWTGIGNIDVDPCFVEPGYCDSNGTPHNTTDDFWVHGDYHLKSQAGRWDPNSQTWVYDNVTSPCVGAGNPGSPLGDEPNSPHNVRINMGAYGGTAEASKSPANWRSIADLTNDWVVDFNDLSLFVGYWLDEDERIPSDLNRYMFVDFADFAIFAQHWLEESSP